MAETSSFFVLMSAFSCWGEHPWLRTRPPCWELALHFPFLCTAFRLVSWPCSTRTRSYFRVMPGKRRAPHGALARGRPSLPLIFPDHRVDLLLDRIHVERRRVLHGRTVDGRLGQV